MVRCADCGFLSLRKRGTTESEQVEPGFRQNWPLFDALSINGYYPIPCCFTLAHKFGVDVTCKENPASAINQEIKIERKCESFTPWIPNFSPKEHKEMQHLIEQRRLDQEIRDKERVWQEDRRKEDLEWRARQEQAAEARWQKENKLQRFQLLIVGIVGTFILAGSQIVGSFMQANASKNQPPIIINIPEKSATQR